MYFEQSSFQFVWKLFSSIRKKFQRNWKLFLKLCLIFQRNWKQNEKRKLLICSQKMFACYVCLRRSLAISRSHACVFSFLQNNSKPRRCFSITCLPTNEPKRCLFGCLRPLITAVIAFHRIDGTLNGKGSKNSRRSFAGTLFSLQYARAWRPRWLL